MYIHTYIYVYVVNKAKQSEIQNVNKTDLIHYVSGINPSSGENNKAFQFSNQFHLKKR